MLQVYKNTNAPPEKWPDFSTQALATLGLKEPKFFFQIVRRRLSVREE
jgi:hypothetical protein